MPYIEAGTTDHLERITELYFGRRSDLDEFNKAQTEEIEFALKGLHWKNEKQRRDGPADRVQPVGRETLSALLHMAGDISSSEIYLDVRPVDRTTDPMVADLARGVLEWEILQNPYKLYADIRDRVTLFALAGRMWGATIDFDPDAGVTAFGEVVVREVDGRMMGWPAGFHDPHDLKCPWWYEVQRMPMDAVRYHRDWKNTADVQPDNDPIYGYLQSEAIGTDRGMTSGGLVTVVRWWERDRTKKAIRRPEAYRKLKDDERYMACGDDADLLNGCGFQSATQGSLGFELPEVDEGACPTCAKAGIRRNLQRIDAVEPEDEYLQYPKGRLTVFQPGTRKAFYDDQWPQKMRSFPVLTFAARDYPGEISGQSITAEYWSRQLQINVSDRVGLEHLMKALPYVAVPDGQIKTYQGEEWYGDQEQGLLLRYPAARGRSGIELIQASGIPQGWPTLRSQWLASFQQTQGTNDMPLDAGASRDIPVGTMEAFERIRSVPTQYLITRLRRGESRFFPVWWDVLRDPSTNPEARLQRFLGPDGMWKLQALRFSELPNFDILVTANPNIARYSQVQMQALAYVANLPRHQRRFVARALNIPISMLRELEEEEQRAMNASGAIALQPGSAGAALPGPRGAAAGAPIPGNGASVMSPSAAMSP